MRPRKITDVKTFLVGGSWRNWLIVKMETDIDGLHVRRPTLEDVFLRLTGRHIRD
jgi:hypothetical protein